MLASVVINLLPNAVVGYAHDVQKNSIFSLSANASTFLRESRRLGIFFAFGGPSQSQVVSLT